MPSSALCGLQIRQELSQSAAQGHDKHIYGIYLGVSWGLVCHKTWTLFACANALATGVTVLCMDWNLEQILCKFHVQKEAKRGREEREREGRAARQAKPEANPVRRCLRAPIGKQPSW